LVDPFFDHFPVGYFLIDFEQFLQLNFEGIRYFHKDLKRRVLLAAFDLSEELIIDPRFSTERFLGPAFDISRGFELYRRIFL
jgi:hypothetical protein